MARPHRFSTDRAGLLSGSRPSNCGTFGAWDGFVLEEMERVMV